ncbi:hypothetical protein HYS94_00355 [Candidatus Daviesbacteria bacterium]|nr:hypothetical protein [Candidatus Daviesbacteria bacterium]
MSKEEGFAHIFILLAILVVIVVAILIFLGIQASKTLNFTSTSKAQYQNPFEQTASYQNPFETYQNPFADIKQ